MSRNRRTIPAKYRYHRPILSDILPFEVPPSFSNGGFFDFLTRYDVRLLCNGNERWVVWEAATKEIDQTVRIIFGLAPTASPVPSVYSQVVRGKLRTYRKIRVATKDWTRPLNFDVSHKSGNFRRLTVVHPRNQLSVADFYHKRTPEILYYTSLSEFSIRRPSGVATTSYFDDSYHQARLGSSVELLQEAEKEYRNLGSFFVYSRFSNVHKFYEHYSYHNAEKRFDRLLKLDISRCFDSIYTHSLPWSVLGIEAAKDNLKKCESSFGSSFDELMQHMNRGETNGIVIGPEFSRIFAEIILQGIDRKLVDILKDKEGLVHRSDYRIYRYVDDYFVFHDSEFQSERIQTHLALLLRQMKLNLNAGKSTLYEKPIITPQTIAKNRTSETLSRNIGLIEEEVHVPLPGSGLRTRLTPFVRSSKLIVEMKTLVREAGVEYDEILNYALSGIETALRHAIGRFQKHDQLDDEKKALAKAFVGLLEFAFFIFAAAPKVNFSVKLARIVTLMVDGMNDLKIDNDTKHHVRKYAHDNLSRQIRRSGGDQYRLNEIMYLLLAMEKLGRKYLLPEDAVASCFGLQASNSSFVASWRLDHFSITVCLMYIKNKKRYDRLRKFLELELVRIVESRLPYLTEDTESLLLVLDAQACPYVLASTKKKLAKLVLTAHGMCGSAGAPTTTEVNALLKEFEKAAPFWFTNWNGFDFSIALDNKKSREVY